MQQLIIEIMRRSKLLYAIASVVVAVFIIWAVLPMREKHNAASDQKQVTAISPKPAEPDRPASVSPPTSGPDMSWLDADAAKAMAQPYPDFKLRPLPVAIDKGNNQWTSNDATAPDVIKQLAHNDLEYLGMVKENSRIKRRQLVYRKEPVFTLVERGRAAGEPVRNFTLPGFDGQELQVEVTNADLARSGQQGAFTGHITGFPDSLVTVGFVQGRESFMVQSPETGTFLQGHPREPGEIILTSFDPAHYLPLPGGESIKTKEKTTAVTQ